MEIPKKKAFAQNMAKKFVETERQQNLRQRKGSNELEFDQQEEKLEIKTSENEDDDVVVDGRLKDREATIASQEKEEMQSKKLQVLKERRQQWECGYKKWDKRKEQTYARLFSLLGIYATVVVGIATLAMHLSWLDCIVPTILVAVGVVGFSVIRNLDRKMALILRILDKRRMDRKTIVQEWEDLQRLGAEDSEMEEWCRDEEDGIPSTSRWRLTSVVAFLILLWVVFVAGRCWLGYCKTIFKH